jgi:hypothetical protein
MDKQDLIDYAIVTHKMTLEEAKKSVDSYFNWKKNQLNPERQSEALSVSRNEELMKVCTCAKPQPVNNSLDEYWCFNCGGSIVQTC